MKIEDFPGCCTSSIIYSLGEHGEESVVTVDTINKLCSQKMRPEYVEFGKGYNYIEKTCFAISVDPNNIRTLKDAGFKVIGKYEGIQGTVHVMARGLLDEQPNV